MLSHAGKEVLIKVVAQSIPTYTMGVFLLPIKLCNELDALCARFWWGQTSDEQKIHWKSWNFLTKPKKEGGPILFKFLHNVKLVLNQERDIIIHVILKKNKTRLKIKYFCLFENFSMFLDFFYLKNQKNQKQKQNISTNN